MKSGGAELRIFPKPQASAGEDFFKKGMELSREHGAVAFGFFIVNSQGVMVRFDKVENVGFWTDLSAGAASLEHDIMKAWENA